MHYWNLMCLILILAISQVSQAKTIEELIAAGELEARVVVETPAPFFQKGPILIAVEIGTAHRFKGSTRVREFTVPGSLVRPATKSALNETRRREGDSWAFQTVRFRLYPERPGSLRTPPLATFFSIETKTQGIIEGEIKLQAPLLEVEVPPGVEGLSFWVAATEFKVEESWEGVLETYQVGDAITRIRRFTINGVPAMAIPASPQIKLDGIQVYQGPAIVNDKTVGTSLTGVREERVVFTIKAGGTHTIPGNQIYWFNLKTNAVEQIDLPDRTLVVTGAEKGDAVATTETKDWIKKPVYLLLILLVLAALVLTYFLLRWFQRTNLYRYVRTRLEISRNHRRIKASYMRAAAQQDSRRCLALLYEHMSEHGEWQLSAACATDQQLSVIYDKLMAHAYGDGQAPDTSELKRMWVVCSTNKKQQESAEEIRLNPGPSK